MCFLQPLQAFPSGNAATKRVFSATESETRVLGRATTLGNDSPEKRGLVACFGVFVARFIS